MAEKEPGRTRPRPSPPIAPWVRGALALSVNIGTMLLIYFKGVKIIPGELWLTVGTINGFYFGSPKG